MSDISPRPRANPPHHCSNTFCVNTSDAVTVRGQCVLEFAPIAYHCNSCTVQCRLYGGHSKRDEISSTPRERHRLEKRPPFSGIACHTCACVHVCTKLCLILRKFGRLNQTRFHSAGALFCPAFLLRRLSETAPVLYMFNFHSTSSRFQQVENNEWCLGTSDMDLRMYSVGSRAEPCYSRFIERPINLALETSTRYPPVVQPRTATQTDIISTGNTMGAAGITDDSPEY